MQDTVITDVTTTVLRHPDLPGIQDATIRHPEKGRGSLFVHIKTAAGLEGFAPGLALSRDVIHRVLKPALVGQDPLCIEKLWDDMFWRCAASDAKASRSAPSRQSTSRSGT